MSPSVVTLDLAVTLLDSLVRVKDGQAVSYSPFAQGWLQGGEAWGRPADVQELPDGSLLVSDEKAGAIYRIAYARPS